jgi:ABC-type branched-subunit amino acid transport system ATPase component
MRDEQTRTANGGLSLRATGVTKQFGPVRALGGVDLELAPGGRHGLVGPNGSGKSTLLKIFAGLILPSTGVLRLGERDITRWTVARRARAGLAMKAQVPRVFGDLTASQNLSLATGAPRDTDQSEADASAARHVLDEIYAHGATSETLASEMAHGQRQWLELALALETAPNFLLLDEPTAGMSPEERARTRRILDEMTCGFVLVEHDLGFVADLCDTVTLLNQGQVEIRGTPDEVMASGQLTRTYRVD